MVDYKNILVAVDYTAEARQVLRQANSITKHYPSEITLIHVIEIVPVERKEEKGTFSFFVFLVLQFATGKNWFYYNPDIYTAPLSLT